MTYKLETIDERLDQESMQTNYRLLDPGLKLRCHACQGIYWRVFINRCHCMGCKSYTRLKTSDGKDLRSVTWIKWQSTKYKDGRVRDPITGRSEFVVYSNYLKSRISSTELVLHPVIKGTWYIGKIEEHFKTMSPHEIIQYLKNTLK